MYEVPSVEIACDKFYEILINLFEITIPKYRNSQNSHSYPPWFNTEVISCLRTKLYYFKRYKKYGTNQFYDMFKQYRGRSKVLIDASFRVYINNMQNTLSVDPKKFWSFIQHKKGSSRIPGIMQYKDRILNTPTEIVNGFSEYFKSVYGPHNNILTNETSIDS